VLSPSLGTTTALWDSTLDAFTPRYRVLRHDLPGHGGSPVPDNSVTVETIAGEVVGLLDELGAERVAFCGVSIGGMVGMWLGANAPDRIGRLAVACSGAKLGRTEDYHARAELVRGEGTGAIVEATRGRWFTEQFREAPEAERILDELRTISPDGYAACCEAVAAWDFREELGRVTPPTLALFGAEDPLTTPEVRETLASGIPQIHTLEIENAGHLANVEQPREFAQAVLAHLDEGSSE
jgi:3-oxoadipate enol-lactonase